jgi:hypothetical protein
MSLATALRVHLVAATATATYLAGLDGAQDRVYPLVIPQKKPGGAAQVPCCVTAVGSVDRQPLYCSTDGVVRSRMTLDFYAETFDEAKEMAEAARSVLLDFRGVLGGIADVRDMKLENETELVDMEPGLYRVSQQWAVWHAETFL